MKYDHLDPATKIILVYHIKDDEIRKILAEDIVLKALKTNTCHCITGTANLSEREKGATILREMVEKYKVNTKYLMVIRLP